NLGADVHVGAADHDRAAVLGLDAAGGGLGVQPVLRVGNTGPEHLLEGPDDGVGVPHAVLGVPLAVAVDVDEELARVIGVGRGVVHAVVVGVDERLGEVVDRLALVVLPVVVGVVIALFTRGEGDHRDQVVARVVDPVGAVHLLAERIFAARLGERGAGRVG